MDVFRLLSAAGGPQRARRLLAFALLAVLCSISCIDEEGIEDIDGTDFDPGVATVSFQTISSLGEDDQELTFVDADGTVYTLTESVIFVDQIELELPDDVRCREIEDELSAAVECESAFEDDVVFDDEDINTDAELEINGPFRLDLVTGQFTPDPGPIEIPALDYPEIDLELEDAELGDPGVSSGDEILDRTWLARAEFSAEDGARELVIRLKFDEEVEVDPATLEDGSNLVIVFDANQWLDTIPLTTCLRESDLKASEGRVILDNSVDSGECINLGERLEDALDASVGARIE